MDILLLNHSHDKPPPTYPTPEVTIQFVEFTYYNDRFLLEKTVEKETKYAPLIENIRNKGWQIAALIVITTGIKGAIHQATKTQL
jgi:hypothetical protein